MIGGRRPLQGRKPADRRVRVERPHAPYFRYTGPNQLVARPPRTSLERPSAAPGPGSAGLRSAGPSRARRRSASGSRRRRRWRSSARTRSARPPTRPRRSCGSSSSPGAGIALSLSLEVAIAIAVLLAVVATLLSPGLPGVSRPAAARTPWPKENLSPIARPRRGRGTPDRLRHDRRGVDARRPIAQIVLGHPEPVRPCRSRSPSSRSR